MIDELRKSLSGFIVQLDEHRTRGTHRAPPVSLHVDEGTRATVRRLLAQALFELDA